MHLRNRPLLILLVVVLVRGTIPFEAAQAQDEVVLSVAIPGFSEGFLTPEAFQPFEAETGVKVYLVSGGFPFFPSAADGIDAHLDAFAEYASSADVLFLMNTSSLSVEATRAGYFLNLAPLTGSDPTLYPEDFFPAAWQSFQWDQGVWAVPVALDVITLNYDPEAFDAAGLSYPNAQWTMDDLAYAARALTEYDADGEIITQGFEANTREWLFRALTNAGFYDNSTLPETPFLTNPALEPLLTTWLELEAEGVNVSGSSPTLRIGGMNSVPMRIEGSMGLASNPRSNQAPSAGSFLPGGVVGLDVQGFAVSAGTAYPEAAYALAKYLSNSATFASSLSRLSLMPARQSLVGVETVEPAGPEANARGGPGPGFALRNFSPETEAFLSEAVWRALPASELRYSSYLNLALTKMRDETSVDAHSALQEAEAEAIANVQAAADLRGTAEVAVATPVPPLVLSEGEVALNFGLQLLTRSPANQDQWDQAIAEFVASDPQVAQIVLDTAPRAMVDGFVETYDCFYMSQNAVPDLDPQTVLSLDPFIDADPTFDRNDVVGNVMMEVQRDNKTWALPFMIQPRILRYNPDLFAQAGLIPPEGGWTVDAFTDALHALKLYPEDPAPFVPRDSSYMLMLLAAYGGLPLDYRTDPVTINFTDPATVNAIRQVLDLARDGYIDYSALSGVGGVVGGLFASESDTRAIYPDTANVFGGFVIVRRGDGPDRASAAGGNTEAPTTFLGGNVGIGRAEFAAGGSTDVPTTYPRGNQYTPASYVLSTAYISATAENPEACYRWLSFLAQRPELFTDMPARYSQLSDPALAASRGPDLMAFYNEYASLLQAPNTVVFPSLSPNLNSIGSLVVPQWLYRAFDRYVLEDADLEAELAEAELLAKSYQECEANIPPYDPAMGDDAGGYVNQLIDCAVLIDPSFATLFGGGN
jgi:ABC-type glycerol-3-phosphate transport system substrate-binding protein